MTLVQVTGPAVYPVTLEEVKANSRIDHDDDDTLLGALIAAASEHAEKITGRALVSQSWDLKLDGFPYAGCEIVIPKPPLRSITSISYVDPDGATQTLDQSAYQVIAGGDGKSGVVPAYNTSWPSTRNQRQAVTVRFSAGYVDGADSPFDNSDIPPGILHAITLHVAHLYDNREAVSAGEMMGVPMGYDALITKHCVALLA